MFDGTPGKVYLIGAGPGDPGLITVRGAELLGRADVVLYDGLANEALLTYAKIDAEKICVGKHGHGGSWAQGAIDESIVRAAASGKSVARLKGGDTAVFARTAEEVDRLITEKIPYEIVPGITAALAAGPYAGIPITHRDWSSAVALVTGQMQPADGSQDAEEALDWPALAKFPGTLVLYMGAKTAGYWSGKLMEAGKPASTPVALIRRCSWHDQETLLCDLSTVASTLAASPNFTPPMISVVGEVIRMSKSMDWFSVRPWFGKRVWVTSPKATGNLLAKKLDEQGAMTVVEPVMTIQPPDDWAPVDAMILESGRFDWIVFSSVYGVDGFFAQLKTLGKDGRLLAGAKIAAVGSATANAIAMHSMVCDVVPQAQGAEGIANLFEQNCRGKRFLFVRNPTGETIAMDRLRIAGAEVQSVSTYQQILKHELPSSVLKLLDTNQLDAVTATSKNIAKQAMELLGPSKTKVTWLSLSPSISDLLRQHGCEKILTAPEPSFEQLAALQC